MSLPCRGGSRIQKAITLAIARHLTLTVLTRAPEYTFCGQMCHLVLPVGRCPYSAGLCTKCLVVALAGCSLSVTANVRTKGRRPLVLACDIVTKLSASHRGVRTSEGVDLWPLRAMSLAVEASAADVPDNRPLSGTFAGRVLL